MTTSGRLGKGPSSNLTPAFSKGDVGSLTCGLLQHATPSRPTKGQPCIGLAVPCNAGNVEQAMSLEPTFRQRFAMEICKVRFTVTTASLLRTTCDCTITAWKRGQYKVEASLSLRMRTEGQKRLSTGTDRELSDSVRLRKAH